MTYLSSHNSNYTLRCGGDIRGYKDSMSNNKRIEVLVTTKCGIPVSYRWVLSLCINDVWEQTYSGKDLKSEQEAWDELAEWVMGLIERVNESSDHD